MGTPLLSPKILGISCDIEVDHKVFDPHNCRSLVVKHRCGSKGQPNLLRCNGLQSIEIYLRAPEMEVSMRKAWRVDRLNKFRQSWKGETGQGKRTREQLLFTT